mmetsp:Transcript_30037/g.77495  ORF Transcript_30037/g.77495 Transcript_30037/m.77495 type:complete len:109 (+) Transcript_30037:1204-1530(+)
MGGVQQWGCFPFCLGFGSAGVSPSRRRACLPASPFIYFILNLNVPTAYYPVSHLPTSTSLSSTPHTRTHAIHTHTSVPYVRVREGECESAAGESREQEENGEERMSSG